MAALRYVGENAERLHVDPSRLILIGDSAGAQISAQVAAMVTNPAYAQEVGVVPTITQDQLRGVALCCGILDLASLSDAPAFRSFVRTVGWSYSGTRDFRKNHYFIATVSVAYFVTAAFPPTFIMVGNADPLLVQSTTLASNLESKGVSVDGLFYPNDHLPPLNHEYQFDLSLEDARKARTQLIAFCERCTSDPPYA